MQSPNNTPKPEDKPKSKLVSTRRNAEETKSLFKLPKGRTLNADQQFILDEILAITIGDSVTFTTPPDTEGANQTLKDLAFQKIVKYALTGPEVKGKSGISFLKVENGEPIVGKIVVLKTAYKPRPNTKKKTETNTSDTTTS